MIIVMKPTADQGEIDHVVEKVEEEVKEETKPEKVEKKGWFNK